MSRWKSSLAGSLLINCLLLTGGALYLNYSAPEPNAKPEAIEMEIVSDDAAPSAPQISAPKQQQVDIPPSPTREEVQQMVNDAPNTIPVEDKKVDDKTPTPPMSQNQNQGQNDSTAQDQIDGQNQSSGGNEGEGKVDKSEGLRPISRPYPLIPEVPKAQAVGDTIVVRLYVGTSGNVTSVDVIESSGYGPADDAVVSAVYGWSFYPAKDSDGNPVEATATQRFHVDIK
ncbi:energy transducer TonB [Veillonella caviae]|uniref:energy transducer TonB n=1 Tax=Veillonella caviae TaxID=248316 RepID=UPI00235621C1|nr:TonB family protein [Veillonella caviae]